MPYVGNVTTNYINTSDNTPVVNVPTGAALNTDEFLIVGMWGSNPGTVTPPSGFSSLTPISSEATLNANLRAFVRKATGAEGGTFNFSTSNFTTWSLVCAVLKDTTSVVKSVTAANNAASFQFANGLTYANTGNVTVNTQSFLVIATATGAPSTPQTITANGPAGTNNIVTVDSTSGRLLRLDTASINGPTTISYSSNFARNVDATAAGLTLVLEFQVDGLPIRLYANGQFDCNELVETSLSGGSSYTKGAFFRNITSNTYGVGNTTFIINKPITFVGDRLFTYITQDTSTSVPFTAPSGWTLISNTSSFVDGQTDALYEKDVLVNGSEPAAFTFTSSDSSSAVINMFSIGNVDNTRSEFVSNNYTVQTEATSPVTISRPPIRNEDGDCIVNFIVLDEPSGTDTWSISHGNNYTKQFEHTPPGASFSMAIFSANNANAYSIPATGGNIVATATRTSGTRGTGATSMLLRVPGISKNFGNTSAPGATSFPGSGDRLVVTRYRLTENAFASNVVIAFKNNATSGAVYKAVVLNEHANGEPNTVIFTTAQKSVPAGGGWVRFSPPNTNIRLATGNYYIGAVGDTLSFNADYDEWQDFGGNTRMMNGTFSYATPPATWGTTDGTYTANLILFMDYIPASSFVSNATMRMYANGQTVALEFVESASTVGRLVANSQFIASEFIETA